MLSVIEDYLSLLVKDIDTNDNIGFKNTKDRKEKDRESEDREKKDREARDI